MSVQDENTTDQTQGTPTEVDASQQTTEQSQQASTEEQGTEEGQQQEAQGNEGQQNERDEKGRFKGVQPRIDELTRARREAEREAAYWKQVAQGSQSPAQAAPQRPDPGDFDKYDDYIDALTDWKADQAVSKRMEADSTRKVAETRAQTFAERQVQARTTMPDYDEVVGGSDTPIANHVGESILESDLGPQLAYHFAKNPDALMRLNSMSPTAAAREIGRLEATLSSKPAAPAAPTKKVSNTPAPAGTLGTQGRATTPALQNLSMEEYTKQRKSQGARWAR
jgi:hypothetical protein